MATATKDEASRRAWSPEPEAVARSWTEGAGSRHVLCLTQTRKDRNGGELSTFSSRHPNSESAPQITPRGKERMRERGKSKQNATVVGRSCSENPQPLLHSLLTLVAGTPKPAGLGPLPAPPGQSRDVAGRQGCTCEILPHPLASPAQKNRQRGLASGNTPTCFRAPWAPPKS